VEIELDDELLWTGSSIWLAQRRVEHRDGETAVATLEPRRLLASRVSMLRRTANMVREASFKATVSPLRTRYDGIHARR